MTDENLYLAGQSFNHNDYILGDTTWTEATLRCGVGFEMIRTTYQGWKWYEPLSDKSGCEGVLNRIGETSIVNPDTKSKISFLLIAGSQDIYYSSRVGFKFASSPTCSIYSLVRVIVFPRDPNSFAPNGSKIFGNIVSGEVPDAEYITRIDAGDIYPMEGRNPPHDDFLLENLKAKHLPERGLSIIKIVNREVEQDPKRNPLEQLLSSRLLSKNQQVRDGFRELLNSLVSPGFTEVLRGDDKRLIAGQKKNLCITKPGAE